MPKIILNITGCLIILFLSGCTGLHKKKYCAKKYLFEQYKSKAVKYENSGDLSLALYHWKVANSITTENKKIEQRITGLKKIIQQKIKKHFNNGLEFYKKNHSQQALDEFFKIIIINPDHKESLANIKRIISGEKYSPVSEKIENNNLTKAPIHAKHNVKTDNDAGANIINEKKNAADQAAGSLKQNVDAHLTKIQVDIKKELIQAKNFIKSKNYDNTLIHTKIILQNEPRNKEGLNLQNESYYQKGLILKRQKKYVESLKTLLKVDKGYKGVEKSKADIKKIMTKIAEVCYKRGVKFFLDENLNSAIDQWKRAVDLNPDHQKAIQGIQDAEKLLDKLEKLK